MAKNGKPSLKRAIEATQGRDKFPAISMVRREPELGAMLAKLQRPVIQPQYSEDGNREPRIPNIQRMRDLATSTANNINDSQTTMQVLPDLELGAQILISSILSPKDMITTELNFIPPADIVSPELAAMLMVRVRKFFEEDYKIKPLLSVILRDVLFETGSYPMVVIPENSIDEVINGYTNYTLESISECVDSAGIVKSLGLLGPSVRRAPAVPTATGTISLESLSETSAMNYLFDPIVRVDQQVKADPSAGPLDTHISVTDNFNILKLPKVTDRIKLDEVNKKIFDEESILNFSLEAESIKLNDRELTGLLYKDRSSRYRPVVSLKTDEQLKRKMIGTPLIMHLPSESVIPVYVPGSPEKQIGYFVLLDAHGNPLELTNEQDHYRNMGARLGANGSFPSAMLQKVQSSMNGFSCSDSDHLDYASSIYGEMVEADLLARLRNGAYGNGVAIAKKEEVYRIMLARSLAKQNTQILWVPVSLMTYFALRYNGSGIGKSMLDDMKILNSMRAMVSMANVLAMLKNSIARTDVKIKFDEHDPNPQKTLETVMHEVLRSRQQAIPLGTNNPSDISDWFTRAGMQISYEGHPGMPDVGLEFEDKASNVTKPDTELEDSLRKQSAMGLGLSPETIDSSMQPEFATSVLTNNALLSKRVLQIQEKLNPQIGDLTRKIVSNHQTLLDDMTNDLNNHFDKILLTDRLQEKGKDPKIKKIIVRQILKDFVIGLEAELPRPDSISLENQFTALETFEKVLDKALASWINPEMFTNEIGGDVAGQVTTMVAITKAYFMRKWMAENGVMPELSDITQTMEDGKPAIDLYESQQELLDGLIKSFSKFIVGVQPARILGDKIMQNLGIGASGGGGGGDSSSSPDAGGFGDPGGGGGTDDFSMEIPGDETAAPAGSEQPSEQTSETTETSETSTDEAASATPNSDTIEDQASDAATGNPATGV